MANIGGYVTHWRGQSCNEDEVRKVADKRSAVGLILHLTPAVSPSNPPDKGYRGVKALETLVRDVADASYFPTFVYKKFTAGSFVALGFPR
ncbi:hypothetical protein J6590_091916 [Homalodisca vitripennis]|nr:hypothetical protein J6590_091916 [Homalodisca vitripennis]